MSFRLHCRSCQTAFVVEDHPRIHPATCPKCGRRHVARTVESGPNVAAKEPADAATIPEPDESVFVSSETAARPSRRRLVLALLVIVPLLVAGVMVAVNWPALKRWWKPVPPDPIASIATSYLEALKAGDTEAAQKLGTVELPPAIRTFRSVHHDEASDTRLKGSFAPISAFHAQVDEKFTYDASIGRYTPKNALGPAAEALDALHDAKAKMEMEQIAKKIESGNPDDIFDAAEGLGKTFTRLAEGALAPRKLLPTYQMLIDDANPSLPSIEKQLLLDVAADRATWDALLKRPFATLKTDGPFLLERAEVSAFVIDALGSSGDPPTPLRLTLTRFRLEGIDTGWRVTATQRGGQTPSPKTPGPSIVPPKRSPGESIGKRPR